jgi:histidinol phosphatase-like PHP family hydrolase
MSALQTSEHRRFGYKRAARAIVGRQMFEYVVASPHALLRRGEDQTPRILSAVCTPGVAILGHPRGRMFNSGAGVRADRPRVFKVAAERQVAIELDGNWHRQDVD